MHARIPVLLLGTFHFVRSTDEFGLVTDVTTPARQRELLELVERLARFEPTKVVIEGAWSAAEKWNDRFEQYRRGERELGPDEIYQIGFRLAELCEHDSIHAIDVMDVFYDERFAEANREDPSVAALVNEANERLAADIAEEQALLDASTIGDFLQRMNRPDAVRQILEPYLRYFAPAVAGSEYVGALVVANWYRRNLKIFANLCRVATVGDRLLVLYGMGHVPLLRHFAESSGLFELVDPLAYLG